MFILTCYENIGIIDWFFLPIIIETRYLSDDENSKQKELCSLPNNWFILRIRMIFLLSAIILQYNFSLQPCCYFNMLKVYCRNCSIVSAKTLNRFKVFVVLFKTLNIIKLCKHGKFYRKSKVMLEWGWTARIAIARQSFARHFWQQIYCSTWNW